MSDGDATRLKVLTVVSGDFGELANALYLLDGAAAETYLLLPPRLHEANREYPPYAVSQYRSAKDVIAAIRQHKPQVVLLFSGYLFGVNGILEVDDLVQVIQTAREIGARVATTDPFLGLMSRLTEETLIHPQRAALATHFSAVTQALWDVPHIYVSTVPSECAATSWSFYNPRLVISQDEKASLARSVDSLPSAQPHWLFVLSLEDYVSQCSIHGRGTFDEFLVRIMKNAIDAGRRPVLLAPQTARDSLAGRLPAGAAIMPFCSYAQFKALLLTAEHFFCWNVVSNSILARVANGGSVFFFDHGHLARSIPTLMPQVMRNYYKDAELPMLDRTQPLDPRDLSRRAALQADTFAPALAAFRSLPSPDSMFASLLGRGDA